MNIFDISRKLSTTTAEWPGDQKFSIEITAQITEGSSVNLTSITTSPHVGTHVDAPWHYSDAGTHPADLPLEPFIGPVQVITASGYQDLIRPENLNELPESGVKRVLIKTGHSDISDDVWNPEFPGLSPDLVTAFAHNSVKLIGVDTPSVDGADSKTLEAHHLAGEYAMMILENLDLFGVDDGFYELIALPLKIDGVCASPVRAVLIKR